MENKGFDRKEVKGIVDGNGKIKDGWEELAEQSPEFWSKESIGEAKVGEVNTYKYKANDQGSFTDDEGMPLAEGTPIYGFKYEEHQASRPEDLLSAREAILQNPDLFPSTLKTFQQQAQEREIVNNRRYSGRDRQALAEKNERIKESDKSKTERQKAIDEASKKFELAFPLIVQSGLFDIPGEKPAEIIFPSDYDDKFNGVDVAAIIPIEIKDEDGKRVEVVRQLVTFDLTTNADNKIDEIKDTLDSRGGFTSIKYPSSEQGEALKPTTAPHFVLCLPYNSQGRSELGDVFSALSKGDPIPNDIQKIIDYQIQEQAAALHKRITYDIKRKEPQGQINQDQVPLKTLKERRAIFDNISIHFDERLYEGVPHKSIIADRERLTEQYPEALDYLDSIRDFLARNRERYQSDSYSVSPDD